MRGRPLIIIDIIVASSETGEVAPVQAGDAMMPVIEIRTSETTERAWTR
jgi:hypothetical protein